MVHVMSGCFFLTLPAWQAMWILGIFHISNPSSGHRPESTDPAPQTYGFPYGPGSDEQGSGDPHKGFAEYDYVSWGNWGQKHDVRG